jgi:competence ComEA-like helix-hairpin-helix protein
MRKVTAILLMVLFLSGVLGVTAPFALGEVKESEKVNINRASISDLYGFPGMTEPLAKAIKEYSLEGGRFDTLNDLLKVPGMTKEYLDRIAPYIIILPEGDDISLPKY